MALIGDIRKRSGLLIAIVGVALAAFVLGDLFSAGPRRGEFNIGVIEGDKIPIMTFNQRLEENLSNRRLNMGRDNLTPEEQFSVRQSTWEEMVREILLNREFDRLGITVTTEELDDLVRGRNPHNFIRQSFTDPQTGMFDPASVTNFLANWNQVEPDMRRRYLALEEAIREDQRSKKHQDLVARAYHVPDLMAEVDYFSKNKQATVMAAAIRYNTIPDDEVSVSERELKRFYDNNTFRFKQDEGRTIDYIVFDLQASAEDRQAIQADFNKLYEEFKEVRDVPFFVNTVSDTRYDSTWFKRGELPLQIEEALFDSPEGTIMSPFMDGNRHLMAKLLETQNRPDSLKASHILISFREAGLSPDITRSREQAQDLADSLFREINRNRRKFEEIASTISDDQTAAMSGGDLGWFVDGAMVYPFNQAVLEGRVGQVVQVETRFGYHIVEITGKTAPVRKVRVAVVDRLVEPSTRTIQETYVNASQFAVTNKTAAAFDKAVIDAAMTKRTATNVRPMDNSIAGINQVREIIRWMYSPKTKLGDVSYAFDVDGSFVVAVLKDIQQEGVMPFERAKGMVEPLVKREKKAEILSQRINDAAKTNNDIVAIASTLGAKVDTLNFVTFNSVNLPNFGREPKVIGEIFALGENVVSGPVAGENAVYVVKVIDFTDNQPDAETLKSIRNVMVNSFRSRASREVIRAIEDNAKIEDNRILYF
jgi:peptidyl-prolyl cis-trans isomerase D